MGTERTRHLAGGERRGLAARSEAGIMVMVVVVVVRLLRVRMTMAVVFARAILAAWTRCLRTSRRRVSQD